MAHGAWEPGPGLWLGGWGTRCKLNYVPSVSCRLVPFSCCETVRKLRCSGSCVMAKAPTRPHLATRRPPALLRCKAVINSRPKLQTGRTSSLLRRRCHRQGEARSERAQRSCTSAAERCAASGRRWHNDVRRARGWLAGSEPSIPMAVALVHGLVQLAPKRLHDAHPPPRIVALPL